MTRCTSTARRGALLAVLPLLLVITPSRVANSAPEPTRAAPAIELVSQTPSVARGGTFEVRMRLPEAPADGNLEVLLHGRVRSRTELATSIEGVGLRSQVYNVTTPIASLAPSSDGSRTLRLSLDPTAPGGVALTTAGVYPLVIAVQDANGGSLASLITHVLVRPDSSDQSPPLAIAVLARLDAPTALQPDGSVRLSQRLVQGAASIANALAANEVPATLALRPETLDALAASGDPERLAVLEQLKVAAAGRSVLALPYADVSPDALDAAGLDDELGTQLDQGRETLARALGVEPTGTTWLAGPDLDLPGAAALHDLGMTHVVVDPDQMQALRAGVLSLSLAQPFLVGSDRQPLMDAMALDPLVTDRIGTPASPGLEVSRLLAELAMLWFEQPGIARGVVVPVDPSVRGDVVQGLLAGIDGGMFRAIHLDDVFDSASPLRQPGGARVDRALRPARPLTITRRVAAELQAARSLLSSFGTIVGADHPLRAVVDAHVLVALATDLTTDQRLAHAEAARSTVASVTGAISAPGRESITLTAREGTVPITLENSSGVPANVIVRLRSTKLEFPDGDTLTVTLTDPTTRLNIPVRARASGTFPLRVSVTSPDGLLTLAAVDYSVQSTAVSGVGLVLSLGAAVFLMIWWARHWRRTRRSEKLVASAHPPTGPPEDDSLPQPR
ncbi:MAG: DUF6049 family protein [Microthrixaceae bacterium]